MYVFQQKCSYTKTFSIFSYRLPGGIICAFLAVRSVRIFVSVTGKKSCCLPLFCSSFVGESRQLLSSIFFSLVWFGWVFKKGYRDNTYDQYVENMEKTCRIRINSIPHCYYCCCYKHTILFVGGFRIRNGKLSDETNK